MSCRQSLNTEHTSLISGISPIFQKRFTYLMIHSRSWRWIVNSNDIMHSCFINRDLVTIMFCAGKFLFVDQIWITWITIYFSYSCNVLTLKLQLNICLFLFQVRQWLLSGWHLSRGGGMSAINQIIICNYF